MKRMRGFNQNRLNRILASALCVVMTVSLAACGDKNTDNNTDNNTSDNGKEYVYVPEYISLGEKDDYLSNITQIGNSIYYSQYQFDEENGTSSTIIREYSLEDGSSKDVPVQIADSRNLSSFVIDSDKNFYVLSYDYDMGTPDPDGYMEPARFLSKYDASGNEIFDKDITEELKQVGESSWIDSMALDSDGMIYLSVENNICLYDGEGEARGSVSLNDNWINGIGQGKDGKVYINYYDHNGGNGTGVVLSEIDPQGKKLAKTYHNFPGGNGFSVGIDKDFMCTDGSKLYEYDSETETYEELLAWLDCNINGSYVNYIGASEDGRIVAITRDWESNATEVVKLTKTPAADVVQKEQIVIGCINDDQALQAAAVAFNKSSDKYQVTIKTYMDSNNWTENSYSDAITAINNDITSGANCPDIFNLSQLDERQLAAKGVFEDLYPYLEKSSVLSKDGFVDNILDSLTYDGQLFSIPATFAIYTVVGKSSVVGDEMGWSVGDMIECAKKYPDAQLFSYMQKGSALYYCMAYNEDAFVDWENGECHFDSDEFKEVLEFVNMFPDEIDWNSYDGSAEVEMMQENKLLLDNVYLSDFRDIQEYPARFGEPVTFVGYPTMDGSVGCMLNTNSRYGITTKSQHKEGAWEFIESYISTSNSSRIFSWGFPALKDRFEEELEEATHVEYLLDENGEQVLDENGEPIEISNGMVSMSSNGWEYTYHTPTQEEVDQLMDLIAVAGIASGNSDNDVIMSIINEEAEAYFQGQQSLDKVVDVIQNRAQTYVSENS